ncbi:MAG: transcriptional regulatory protein RtcR, partial [bacterium]
IERLKAAWYSPSQPNKEEQLLESLLGKEGVSQIDRFDKIQLLDVLSVCNSARTLSEAGRELFASSRGQKKNINDADRLRKYLARFNLQWQDIKNSSDEQE